MQVENVVLMIDVLFYSDQGIVNINLQELNAGYNSEITNVNHMSKLIILDASGKCGIDDRGIINVNLQELHAQDNPKITNVNHMSKLIKLNASGECGIDDRCIILQRSRYCQYKFTRIKRRL